MIIKSQFSGRCLSCGQSYKAGEQVDWMRGKGSRHLNPQCAPDVRAPLPAAQATCRVVDSLAVAGVWYFEGPFETKDIAKRALWFFHGEDCSTKPWPCKACPAGVPKKVWWTDAETKLGDLVRHYDEATGDKPLLVFANETTATLARHLARETSETIAGSSATDADVDLPRPAGQNYLPYQRAGIAYALSRKNVLFGDEMGLGKTIQAIGLINAMRAGGWDNLNFLKTAQAVNLINSDENAKQILVLCPASLRVNWQRELEKWLVRPHTISLPNDPSDLSADILIVNYDKVVGKSGEAMLAALMSKSYDILVADEAHFLKNPKAKRTIAVLGRPASWDKKTAAIEGLVTRATRFAPLTGTLILNGKPIEAWPLLAALCPEEFGDFWKFVRRYCGAQKVQHSRYGASHWDFSGATNLDELQERMRRHVMVRRLKADVLKELPPKRRQVITLTVEDDKVRKLIADERAAYDGEASEADEMARAIGEDEYRKVVESLWASHKETAEDRAAIAEEAYLYGDDYNSHRRSRGTQDKAGIDFGSLSAARHKIALAKVPAVIEHLDGMLEEGVAKILVFAHHLDVIAKLKEHFGERAVVLTGQTPLGERQNIVDRFQNDASVQIFIGNTKAAGVGYTLTAACHVVFAELDWVPANVTQAEDRAHRIGQLNVVLIQHLVLDESLDAQFAKVIVEKQDIADAALDDERVALDIRQPVRLPPRHPKLPEGVSQNERGERSYPAVSDEERALIHQAMRIIAGMCDGAHKLDMMGFNKIDARFGMHLAALNTLTDGQAWAGKRLARVYRRQLPESIVEKLDVGAKPEKTKRGGRAVA